MFVISCESQVNFILVYFVVPIIFVFTKNKGVSYSQIRFFNTLFYFYNPLSKTEVSCVRCHRRFFYFRTA